MSQSKNYQIPKNNHPWRQYKTRFTPLDDQTPAEKLPNLHQFLKDIVDNWDTYQIPSNDLGEGYVKIKSAQPQKSAEWIASFIRKTWVKQEREYYVEGLT